MPGQPPSPAATRYKVISAAMIVHVMEHPARGTRWSLRELADAIGCSHATLGYLRDGTRDTVSAKLAVKFAEAVGCETAVLFVPVASTKSDDTSTEAIA